MAENALTSDSFPTKTKEQELINETEDMQTDDFTKQIVDRLVSEGNTEFEEEIPSAQVLRQNTSSENKSKQPKERPSTLSDQQNGPGRKRFRDQDQQLNSFQETISSSNNSIDFLENHQEKGTCLKTLQYNAWANITPDEDFKRDISSIRKEAEKALVGALVKFHRRSIERLTNMFRKLKETKPRKRNFVNKQQSSNRKKPPTASEKIVKKTRM